MSAAAPTSRPPAPGKLRKVLVEFAALAVLAICVSGLDANWAQLVDAPTQAWLYGDLIARGVLNNPFAEPSTEYWKMALEYMADSLAMAWIGTMIGAILSLPIGFLAASNIAPRWLVVANRQLLNAIRTVPDLIFAMVIMIPIFGLGPIAGALALGLGSIGTLGKLTAEAIEGIAPATLDAVRATGARPLQVMRWGVLPQVLPEIAAFWLYRFEVNIRAGAILGAVGAGGIGSLLVNLFSVREWDRIGIALFVIVAVTMIVDTISGAVRHRIVAGSPTRTAVPA